MITEEHLNHWLDELKYSLTSITIEINKKEFVDNKGVTIDGGFLSLEYLREKAFILAGTIRCIEDDMRLDNATP